jgi:hypothetical protein
MDIASFTQAVTLPSLDWLIVILVFAILTFDATRNGTSRAAAVAISAILTYALFEALQSAAYISAPIASLSPAAAAGLVIALAAGIFYLVSSVFDSYEPGASLVPALMAAAAATAILLAVWHAFVPLMALWDFNTVFNQAFQAAYRFWWLIAGLAVLAFAR